MYNESWLSSRIQVGRQTKTHNNNNNNKITKKPPFSLQLQEEYYISCNVLYPVSTKLLGPRASAAICQ